MSTMPNVPDRSSVLDIALALATAAVLAWGVLVLDWSPFIVMALFWVENVVIGIFNLLKMLFAGARLGWAGLLGAIAVGAFFTVHYGLFTLVHGAFVVMLFGGSEITRGVATSGLLAPIGAMLKTLLTQREGWVAIGAIAAVHANATIQWLLRTRELPPPIKDLMVAPYGRILILHVTLIAGGFLMQAFGAPRAGALLLIGLKLAYDLRAVRRDRQLEGDDEAARRMRQLLVIGRRRLDGRP